MAKKPNQMGRFNAKQLAVNPRGKAWAQPSKGGTANESGHRGSSVESKFTVKKPNTA